MAEEKRESGTAIIRPNIENYESSTTASGSKSQICGDDVSKALAGMNLDEVKQVCSNFGMSSEEINKYDHLNIGQRRMNLGNRIRGLINKANADYDKAKAKKENLKEGEEPVKMPKTSGELFSAAIKAPSEARDARVKQVEAEKAKAKKEKEDAAAAKKAAAEKKKADAAAKQKAAEKAKTDKKAA